jgi:hypothetical protein
MQRHVIAFAQPATRLHRAVPSHIRPAASLRCAVAARNQARWLRINIAQRPPSKSFFNSIVQTVTKPKAALCQLSPAADMPLHPLRSESCRYCCKSLFALVIKNSPGCGRHLRVKMWGTSSPDDKLTGDLGNVIEATQIGGRRSDRLMAGKLSPGNLDFCNNIGTTRTQ